jgi:hypothetical protein
MGPYRGGVARRCSPSREGGYAPMPTGAPHLPLDWPASGLSSGDYHHGGGEESEQDEHGGPPTAQAGGRSRQVADEQVDRQSHQPDEEHGADMADLPPRDLVAPRRTALRGRAGETGARRPKRGARRSGRRAVAQRSGASPYGLLVEPGPVIRPCTSQWRGPLGVSGPKAAGRDSFRFPCEGAVRN